MKAHVIEKTVEFEFCGRKYPLKATMNVEADIQEQLGDISSALTEGNVFRNLIKLLVILLNEAVDIHNDNHPDDQWEPVTERFVGRHITHDDAEKISNTIIEVFTGSRPETDPNDVETDDEKNEKA